MNQQTIKFIREIVEKIKPYACEDQLAPALAALDRGDYEHVLAIGRGNIKWLEEVLKDVPVELLNGPAIRYYKGGVKQIGFFHNGKRQGVWRDYYHDGSLALETHFEDDLCQGLWRQWYFGIDQLSEECYYKNSVRHGAWRKWHKNGVLAVEGHYENDLHQGLWREWHSNGQLKVEGNYKDDLRQGVWRWWYPDGSLAVEKYYN